MMEDQSDVVVVGAGLVGLAVGLQLLKKQGNLKVAIVEQENTVGSQQSGHNSGVVHSGIYYKSGTNKATMCIAGARELIEYCKKRDIAISECGKLIVAINHTEMLRLGQLYENGCANGMKGIEKIGSGEICDYEPQIQGSGALWVPQSAIVNYRQVAASYSRDVGNYGGVVGLSTKVMGLYPTIYPKTERRIVVETTKGDIHTKVVVGCGGLQADRLTRSLGLGGSLRIVPFRGSYFSLSEEKAVGVRHLVYPVPNPEYPFLGIHFTPWLDGNRIGGVWIGPTAALAFSRSRYRRRSFSLRDSRDILGEGLGKFFVKHWKAGCVEEMLDRSKRAFTKQAAKYMPSLVVGDLKDGPLGLRAQALNGRGELVDDFVVVRPYPGVLNIINAPSPAATSSLALGKYIADLALEELRCNAGG